MTSITLHQKSIIIYIPDHVGLPTMFRDNLQSLGLTVYALVTPDPENRISIKDVIVHNFRKMFMHDRTYKSRIYAKNRHRDIIQTNIDILDKIRGKADYALIIRPDLLSDEVIKKAKSKAEHIIGYQWDGLDRFPAVYDKIQFFDPFFVFDKKDIAADKRCRAITNFYFDHLFGEPESPDTDVYFIGSYVESRMQILTDLAVFFKNNNLVSNLHVIGNATKHILPPVMTGINHAAKVVDFQQNYHYTKKTKAVLDLVDDAHSGLSLRVFEAIGFKKKLITNNPEVVKYDFYRPNNIFIIKDGNIQDIKDFMQKPFEELPEDIHRKYGFENWLRNVLDIPAYTALTD